MKKFIITFFTIVIVIFGIIMLRGMYLMTKVNSQPSSYIPEYKYVENLNGIGCLKIGMTSSEAKKALDSTYHSHEKKLSAIDKYAKIFKLVKPYREDTPLEYYPNYREYRTSLILAEDFIVDDIELYFWEDTLYRIHLHDARGDTKQIGDGLVIKYGDGLGHNKNEGYYEDQYHRWGNNNCITTYVGKTTSSSEGPRYFYDVEVITKDLDLPSKIKSYLETADSLWTVKRNAEKYKNL